MTYTATTTGQLLHPRIAELLTIGGASPFVADAGTLLPVRLGNRVYVPLLCDIGSTSVTAAIENATTFVTSLNLYPGKNSKLFKTYTEIVEWCTSHDIDRLADLVDDTARQLICDLAGIKTLEDCTLALPAIGKRLKSMTPADRLKADERRRGAHSVRNILVSVRTATVLTHRRERKYRLTDDRLDFGLPVLPVLEDRTGRPLTDEEILLSRLLVELDRAEGAPVLPLLAYLIAETGIRPIESTALETKHLDSRTEPTTVTATGAWEFGKRTVKLAPYVSATLPVLLAQLRTGDQPLTYTGTQPGTGAATASLSVVITRHLRRAGVTDEGITPKSLSLWRAHRAVVHHRSMRKARKYHGGATANVLEDLKLHSSEDTLIDGQVELLSRETGLVVTSLGAGDFYDASITASGKRRKRKNRAPQH